jgi:hypothetical protein
MDMRKKTKYQVLKELELHLDPVAFNKIYNEYGDDEPVLPPTKWDVYSAMVMTKFIYDAGYSIDYTGGFYEDGIELYVHDVSDDYFLVFTSYNHINPVCGEDDAFGALISWETSISTPKYTNVGCATMDLNWKVGEDFTPFLNNVILCAENRTLDISPDIGKSGCIVTGVSR